MYHRAMRRLRLVVRSSRGMLPAVVAVGLVSTAACGAQDDSIGTTSGVGATAGQGGADAGAAGAGGAGGIVIDAGSGGAGGGELCGYGLLEEYEVELPPEGTPATPDQVCAVVAEPVESGRAARVVLTLPGPDLQVARGLIEIEPALRARVVGLPVVEVIDATAPALSGLTVQNLTPVAEGFTFDATFADPIPTDVTTWELAVVRMTVRVSLEIGCPPSAETKTLHAATDLHLCIDDRSLEWVSSGERCIVCRVVAEMAPSPIPPGERADALPLARALRVRVRELARISNTLVLLAEHDGGEGLQYDWHPSAGEVERLAPDVVAWTVEEGMQDPMIQAAVWGEAGAAVASFAWNEAP